MSKVLRIEDIELAFRIDPNSVKKNAYDFVVFDINILWRRKNAFEWTDLRLSNVSCLGDHRISDLEDFIRNSTIPDEEKENILQQRTLDFNKLSRLFDKHTDQFLIVINQWFDEAYWVEKKEIKRYLKQWLETGGLDRIDFELGEDNLYHISFRCRNEYVLICGSKDCLVAFNKDDYEKTLASKEDAIAFIEFLLEEKRKEQQKEIQALMDELCGVDPGDAVFKSFD